MTGPVKQAIVSIHDVMPATLEQVQGMVELAQHSGLAELTLLVVPGLDWDSARIDKLRAWQAQGCTLAGHGWSHRGYPPRSIVHRFHSRVLSRDVAEHLSASPRARLEIMSRCADWFDQQQLGLPALYVPPAWALALRRDQLRHIPFRMIETLFGIIECPSGRFRMLPLVGFEADTVTRQVTVSCSNGANLTVHRLTHRPLRVSLHPQDLTLKMSSQLRQLLAACQSTIGYEALLAPGLDPSSRIDTV